MFIGEFEAFYIARSNCFKYITVLTMPTLNLHATTPHTNYTPWQQVG